MLCPLPWTFCHQTPTWLTPLSYSCLLKHHMGRPPLAVKSSSPVTLSSFSSFIFLLYTYQPPHVFCMCVSSCCNASCMRTGALVCFGHCWVCARRVVRGVCCERVVPVNFLSSSLSCTPRFPVHTGGFQQVTVPQACLLLKSCVSLKVHLRHHLFVKLFFLKQLLPVLSSRNTFWIGRRVFSWTTQDITGASKYLCWRVSSQ